MAHARKSFTPTPASSDPPAAPVAASEVPSLEDRFLEIEQRLAVLLMLARAASGGGDLGLFDEDESAAWCAIDHSLYDALRHLRAIKAALDADLWKPAPAAAEGVR